MRLTLILSLISVASAVFAIDVFEVEPNNTAATANNITGLTNGSSLFGSSSVFDKDYFNVSYANVPFGIYRKSLALLPRGPEVVFEGQLFANQTFNDPWPQWYSFGSASPVHLLVQNDNTFPYDPYQCQFYIQPITPTNLGTFQQGNFRFQEMSSQFDFGILDLQIFDSQGRIVPGGWNTNEFPTFFDFSMELGPGTYYAIAGECIRSEVNRFGSPLGVGNVMASDPIGGVAINAAYIQITTPTSSVSLTDVGHRLSTGPDYIVPYTFTVVPEPASLLALGAGLAMLGRKRWRR